MAWFTSPLDDVRVASPCSADWDQMYGDERKRFCKECKLNVYNLSGMKRDEAEALITNAEGRLCVRFFRRVDGSIITADCPVGWARVKQKTRRHLTAAFSLLAALFTGTFVASYFNRGVGPQYYGAVAGAMEVTRPSPTPMMGNFAISGVLGNGERNQEKASIETPRRTLRKIAAID